MKFVNQFLVSLSTLTLAACGSNDEVEQKNRDADSTPVTSSPPQLPSSAAADDGSAQENSVAPAQGKSYYYSFTRSNPGDSVGQQSFGADQATKVRDALSQKLGDQISMDVELDPLKTSIADIRAKFSALKSELSSNDTFIMYSHSHGLLPGLGIDWNFARTNRDLVTYKWDEFAEGIVSLPAKNVVIFTMSCHSGYLTEALNRISSKWEGQRKTNGRNLVVLTAVNMEQESSPTNNDTSITGIGNPFTYAVRTAIGGAADGAVDGQMDGKISMKELVRYVLKTSKDKSKDKYAEPQFAGEYSDNDIFL